MSVELFLFLGIAVPLSLAAITLRFAWPAARGVIAGRIALVSLIPLVLLSAYLVLEYRAWRWSVFPYGSVAPHVVAGALFLAGLLVVIGRAEAPTSAKVLVIVFMAAAWGMLWLTTSLFTACSMGDCL